MGRLPHPQVPIASDWLRSTMDQGKEKEERRSDVSSVFSFPPSFAHIERDFCLRTRQGRPIHYRASVSIIWNPP